MKLPAWLTMRRRSRPAETAAAGGKVTRRQLAGAAALLLPAGAAAGPDAPLPAGQLAALLRGIADLVESNDPVLRAEAEAALVRITRAVPEAPLRVDLHRIYRPRRGDWRPRHAVDLEALYAACNAAQPVTLHYTDATGAQTTRNVLPLEIVHGHQGILLLAQCELRQAFRHFYVHRMRAIEPRPGSFAPERLALLRALVAEEQARFGDA